MSMNCETCMERKFSKLINIRINNKLTDYCISYKVWMTLEYLSCLTCPICTQWPFHGWWVSISLGAQIGPLVKTAMMLLLFPIRWPSILTTNIVSYLVTEMSAALCMTQFIPPALWYAKCSLWFQSHALFVKFSKLLLTSFTLSCSRRP